MRVRTRPRAHGGTAHLGTVRPPAAYRRETVEEPHAEQNLASMGVEARHAGLLQRGSVSMTICGPTCL